MRRFALILSLFTSLLLAACSSSNSAANPADAGKLRVVATTGQIGDAVQNIAGDKVVLSTLLGPGNIFTFQEADIILYNGLHLEAQIERVLDQIGAGDRIRVVGVGDSIDQAQLLEWGATSGFPHDPHIWNDVRIWKQVVEVIRDTLIQADSANSADYSRNASAYLAELDELHAFIAQQAASLSAEQRVIVTAHDAFNYFGRAYGFEVEAVQGISTQSEASTADIQALAGIVLERKVPAMFVESTISPRTIEAVQAAVRAAGHEVALGGSLYSDALGAPDSAAATYIGMMRHNIDTVVAALSS
jgi:manganese/zinc/iron transport system substrate-binding protein